MQTTEKALTLLLRLWLKFKANEVITKPVTIEGADEGGTKVAYTTVLPKVNGTVIFRNLLYPSAGINGGGSHDSLEYENLNLIFDNCSFTNAGGGCINIYPQIASLTVTNCSFSTTSETYLKQYLIWPYQAKEIDILFNTFDGGGVTRSPIHLGQGHPEGTTAIIENNTISNYERGIQVALETELTGTAKHEITITNNDFSGIKLSSITTAAPEEYGIVFLHEVHNPANTESIIITDNTVSDCGTHLVYSENEAAMEDYNITFTENTEGGSDVGGLEDNFYTPYGTEITFKESESIKYSDDTLGGIRFIFDTSMTDADEVTAFGAYILPFSIFSDNPEDITLNSVNVQYNENINSGDTFSADIVDIPKSAFDTDVYAVPYFVTDGNVNTFTGKDANVNNN